MNEKALCAAMKEAWRGTGYEVCGAGDSLVIRAGDIGIETGRKNASRQVLALLALHLGEIPAGNAYRVSKTNGAQSVMPDVTMGEWEAQRNRAEAFPWKELRRTPMDWKGFGVWQTEEGALLCFDKKIAEIAKEEDIRTVDGLMVCDDGNTLMLMRPHEVMDEAMRNLLAQVSLT